MEPIARSKKTGNNEASTTSSDSDEQPEPLSASMRDYERALEELTRRLELKAEENVVLAETNRELNDRLKQLSKKLRQAELANEAREQASFNHEHAAKKIEKQLQLMAETSLNTLAIDNIALRAIFKECLEEGKISPEAIQQRRDEEQRDEEEFLESLKQEVVRLSQLEESYDASILLYEKSIDDMSDANAREFEKERGFRKTTELELLRLRDTFDNLQARLSGGVSLSDRARRAASTENIRAFRQDGVVCLRGVLTTEEIALLKQGIEHNLANPSPNFVKASSDDDTGLFVEDFCTWQQNQHYFDFIHSTPLPMIAGLLTSSYNVRLYHDHLLVKEPFTKQETPWHQDQPYYNIKGRLNCSFWIPVDHVALESTLEFALGSHKNKKFFLPRSFRDKKAKWFREGSLREVPTDDEISEKYDIGRWEIDPGDIVCFHMQTLHRSSGVPANARRRVYSVRFVGHDTTFVHRPWVTSPPFPGLEDELDDGSHLDHPLFPMLWSAAI